MCNNTRWYRDQRYPEQLIAEVQLKREYGEHIADGSIDPDEQTFQDFVHNCMETQGGTLSEAISPDSEPKATYRLLVRETLEMQVTVEASDMESAIEEVQKHYNEGEYDLDRNCFAGAEFRPCCTYCYSDFEDDYELREVDEGTDKARVLCDRCLADMENNGELTRCESCHELFSPSRLKVNPENSEREICPICGNVWCD